MALTPTQTRELLARLGVVPRRFLGQNFLVDGNIARKSVELAAVGPGDTVVEVGPGLGALTVSLLEAGAEVWAVECDRALAAHLAADVAPRFPGKLHLTVGDAVGLPLAGLPAGRAPGCKVVANLPYCISSPWIDAVLSGPLPSRMVLMLQREAAERYTARSGTRAFGAISVFLQAAYGAAAGHRVSPTCFHPRPEVGSVLLCLGRRDEPLVFGGEQKAFIRACFQQRRKQMGAVLRAQAGAAGPGWEGALARAGIPATARAEAVPLDAWVRLLGALPEAGLKARGRAVKLAP